MTIDEQTNTPPPAGDDIAGETAIGDQYDRTWLGSIARPALLIVMVSMIDVAILAFLRQYAPDMTPAMGWTILGLGVLAAIIGVTTTTWLALPDQRLRRSGGYRAAEIALLLAVTRGAIWAMQGIPDPLDVLTDPTGVFADGYFLIAAITVMFTWFAAIDFTGDMAELALQPDELWVSRRTELGTADSARAAPTDRPQVVRRFLARWVGWGIFLILLASTLRLGVTRPSFWALGRQDVDPLVVGAILTYFVVGLLLLSQGQLAMLRARWTVARLPAAPGVTRNWPIYTAIVLLVFAAIAAFLPLGDTYLLSLILSTILNAVFALLYLIFRLVTVAFLMLLSLLPFSERAAEQVAEQPPMQAALDQGPAPLIIPPWVGGLFFWISVAFLIGYAAYFYFSDKDATMGWLRRFLARLYAQLLAFFGLVRSWHPQSGRTAQAEESGAQSSLASLVRRLLPWRLMSPNQRVRFLYFQMLEAAEEHEVARLPSETPDRFAVRLDESLPDAADEQHGVDELTGAFVDVRYAGAEADRAQTERLKRVWAALRASLPAGKEGDSAS